MSKKMGKLLGMVIKFVLALIAACMCMGIAAGARARVERAEKQQAYLERKDEVVKEIRDYLSDSGYPYSGVTLTRRDDGDGREGFLLSVHHGKLEKLSEEEREELCEELADFGVMLGEDAFLQVRIQ